jgi:hypothetical protein
MASCDTVCTGAKGTFGTVMHQRIHIVEYHPPIIHPLGDFSPPAQPSQNPPGTQIHVMIFSQFPTNDCEIAINL